MHSAGTDSLILWIATEDKPGLLPAHSLTRKKVPLVLNFPLLPVGLYLNVFFKKKVTLLPLVLVSLC